MTDKPKIEVGQRWVTRGKGSCRILATDSHGIMPIVVDLDDGGVCKLYPNGTYRGSPANHDEMDLICLAPQKIKRQVALYRWKDEPEGAERASTEPFAKDMLGPGHPRMLRISEIVAIEFPLLPGESA